jgi:glycosyltransferase involved in cell wall biosynthesis
MFCSDSTHVAEPPRLQEAYVRDLQDGVEVWWVRTLKYSGAKSLRRALSWLHFEWRLFRMPTRNIPRPDIVIASSLSLFSVLSGLYFSYRFKAKFVFEVRDIWPLILHDGGGFSRWNPFVFALRLIEKLGYRRADLIVGTMPNLAAHVYRSIRRRVEVICIPMGVEREALLPSEELSEEFQSEFLRSGKFTVCHAGSIGADNALDAFFACAELMEGDERVLFLIVGDGYLKSHYSAKFGRLRNLKFAPRIPKRQVGSLLAKCDLLYFSTHKSQALVFGQSLNKLVDYMLSGRPVLGSYSGFESMINEAESGMYVPAGDAAALRQGVEKFVLMSATAREEMGARGRAWILENRTYEALARNYQIALSNMFVVESDNADS